MKLLIVTQKVDKHDDVLGFFHRWIEEFAKHAESIVVICLYEGEHHLPANTKVLSLGKEEGGSRIQRTLRYIVRFHKYIWNEQNNYDAVFVHMNQEYVLLGAPLWKILKKKIFMWRNHHFGNVFTRIAMSFCDKIFCTSKYSFTASSPKTVIMPVGIDTESFKRDTSIIREPNSILFLGRISPVKNVDIFINALELLDTAGGSFIATIVGNPSEVDEAYYIKIKKSGASLEKKGKLVFHRGVPNRQTPPLYNRHEIFVNATASGSFDKTILEAAACECLVLVSNKSCSDILSKQFLFKEKEAADLADKLRMILALEKNDKEKYGNIMRQHAIKHDISILTQQIFGIMEPR